MSIMKRAIGCGIALTLMSGTISLAEDVRELIWDDLIPDGGMTEHAVTTDSGNDEEPGVDEDWDDEAFNDLFAVPAYPTGVVEELDGVVAKLPGFVVPLELSEEGKLKDFLLVPYFGACIHYPPPPPNQIVYVKLDKPVDLESPWDPIWATGELKTESYESDLAAAGYTMAGRAIEEYEY